MSCRLTKKKQQHCSTVRKSLVAAGKWTLTPMGNLFPAYPVSGNAGAFPTYQTYKQTLGFLPYFVLFFLSLPPFITAAHLPAATGSMAGIECNWNSNWIADTGEGRREGPAIFFFYNSITKLSHHFRTQTNKVKQWGWGEGGCAQEPWLLDLQKAFFSPLTWDGHPVREK